MVCSRYAVSLTIPVPVLLSGAGAPNDPSNFFCTSSLPLRLSLAVVRKSHCKRPTWAARTQGIFRCCGYTLATHVRAVTVIVTQTCQPKVTGTFPFATDVLPSAAWVWCLDHHWPPHLKDGWAAPPRSSAVLPRVCLSGCGGGGG